ncbi:MAG: hypothetical protein ACYCTF_11005 [Acidiferrobacter sp.]
MARDRACDEQNVCVPGACDQPHPEDPQIIDGVLEGLDLEVAAVARSCVDMPYGKRPPKCRGERLAASLGASVMRLEDVQPRLASFCATTPPSPPPRTARTRRAVLGRA